MPINNKPIDVLEDFKIITDNYKHFYGDDLKLIRDSFVYVPPAPVEEVYADDLPTLDIVPTEGSGEAPISGKLSILMNIIS